MSDSNCLSVGADTKPRRMWPHGEANLHFHISHPHSDGDTHCSLYKMVVIAKMNMMIVRVMGAPGGGDERDDDCVLLLPMTALSLSQVTDAQQIPWLYQDDSRGPGKQQQGG